MRRGEIIFVYNASSSIFALAGDYAHKLLSPRSYQCNLCKLTYGIRPTMDKKWKNFIETLPGTKTFLHKDEFMKRFPKEPFNPPAIYYFKNNSLSLIKNAESLNKVKNIDSLISIVSKSINNIGDL